MIDVTAAETRERVGLQLIQLLVCVDRKCHINVLDDVHTVKPEVPEALRYSSKPEVGVKVKQKRSTWAGFPVTRRSSTIFATKVTRSFSCAM